MARLPERQRAVLVARYGLDGRSPESLQVVSPIGRPSHTRLRTLARELTPVPNPALPPENAASNA